MWFIVSAVAGHGCSYCSLLQLSAVRMYNERFLLNARHAEADGYHFCKGCIKAEMSKDIVYTTNVKIDKHGVVCGSQCECGAGC